jgi:hypothetical protein
MRQNRRYVQILCVVDAHLRCSTRVVKVVTTDESWCDEFVYEYLGEVRQVV